MKKVREKKLVGEEKKIGSSEFKIVGLIVLLVVFVFAVVTIALYVPTTKDSDVADEDTALDTNSYSLNEDDSDDNLSNITCTKTAKTTLVSDASKVTTYINVAQITTDEDIEVLDFSTDPAELKTEKYIADGFEFTIKGITSNIYVEVYNDKNTDTYTATYDDLVNKKYTFQTLDVDEVINYTFTVKSNLEECKGEVIREFNVKAPIYNEVSTIDMCNDSDAEECQTLVYGEQDLSTTDESDFENFNNSINESGEGSSTINIGSFKLNIEFTFLNVLIISSVIIVIILIILFIILRVDKIRRIKKNEKM